MRLPWGSPPPSDSNFGDELNVLIKVEEERIYE